jgi:hypothetical protein
MSQKRLEEAARAKGAVNVDEYVKKLLERSIELRKHLERVLEQME